MSYYISCLLHTEVENLDEFKKLIVELVYLSGYQVEN